MKLKTRQLLEHHHDALVELILYTEAMAEAKGENETQLLRAALTGVYKTLILLEETLKSDLCEAHLK